jgi:Protein of unknown function (DUF1573)
MYIFRTAQYLLLAGCLCTGAVSAGAQDFLPVLPTLTREQKLQILDFMRLMGSEIDQEIADAYAHLPSEQRAATAQYILSLGSTGNTAKATVDWSRDTLHFGKVNEGALLFDSVRVTNTGTSPYVISEAKTACGCTALRLPKRPLLPGESVYLPIEFNTRQKAGNVNTGIIFIDNSAPNTRHILYITADIIPKEPPRKPIWDY